MKRFYLDSNIVLDFLLDRQPFAELAAELLATAKAGRAELLVSSLLYVTSHYVVSKAKGKIAATQGLTTLFEYVTTVAVDATIVQQALHSGRPDFEDAVQFYAALAAGADAIVTRDPKGFPTQQVPVLNPLAAPNAALITGSARSAFTCGPGAFHCEIFVFSILFSMTVAKLIIFLLTFYAY